MTKAELIAAIKAETGITAVTIEGVLEAFVSVAKQELKKGGEISLRNFGIFSRRHRAERQGFNPRDKEPMTIPARDIVHFKPSKSILD